MQFLRAVRHSVGARSNGQQPRQDASTELSMGPFCVTRSNPTRQLTDPTQPNPIQLTMELAL